MLIHPNNFKITIDKLNPLSLEYKEFWKLQKSRCISGYWVSGKWMPGNLFFYTNLWKIDLNLPTGLEYDKPHLRDVDWELSYYYAEARGFSGFSEDRYFHCNRKYENGGDPEGRMFVEPRDYLRKIHPGNLGKPLWENPKKNIMIMGARGWGKSMYVAGAIHGHQFITDGIRDYDIYLNTPKELRNKFKSSTLISSADSKYTNILGRIIENGLGTIDGDVYYAGELHPSPLKKEYTGSFTSEKKSIIAEYEEKIMNQGSKGGTKVWKGSKSIIHARTYKDNPKAANGLRVDIATIDEAGFCDNLLDVFGKLKDVVSVGGVKTGSIVMTGTGGDFNGKSTEQVKQLFYNPEEYDLVHMEDIWENRGRIGLFFPATVALNIYRDEYGNLDYKKADEHILKERLKAESTKNQTTIQSNLQNQPSIPSHSFLTSQGNLFPIDDLQARLGELEADTTGKWEGKHGRMVLTESGVQFQQDFNVFPADYPVQKGQQAEGCITIWEDPIPNPPFGLYIAGYDPYNTDDAPNSVSLGSVFIMKRKMPGYSNVDMIVAEYTGRPLMAQMNHEFTRRLILHYNALCLYENNFNNFKTHLQNKNNLKHLAYTPTSLTKNSSTSAKTYGLRMTGEKQEYELYLADWLLEEVEEGKTNLQLIPSKPLLKELIAYNKDGNFDRGIALMLTNCQRIQMQRVIVKKEEEKPTDPFWNRKFFTR